MNRVSPELEARMIALVEQMAKEEAGWVNFDEARAIVVELPPLPDPDMIEARQVAAQRPGLSAIQQLALLDGKWDENSIVIVALAAIKRGRALARQESPQ